MVDLAAIATNLEGAADGIWRYPEWGNTACFQIEDVSFWFHHRNACILEVLKQYPPSGLLFDVGGGNGFVAKAVQDAGMDVVLLEPGSVGVENARQRGLKHIICAGLEDTGFLPASIPAVGLFDVVEHIADDRGFVDSVWRYLRPGGRMYLTVPAFEALWSHADLDAGHYRRYSQKSLQGLLRNAGFRVEFLTGFFQFLPPAIAVGRTLPYRIGMAREGSSGADWTMRASHEVRSSLVRRPLGRLQAREVRQIRRRRQVAFGASWLLVAQKEGGRARQDAA